MIKTLTDEMIKEIISHAENDGCQCDYSEEIALALRELLFVRKFGSKYE